jgi:pimeloyl-ACP methyl ester carboxylesterase
MNQLSPGATATMIQLRALAPALVVALMSIGAQTPPRPVPADRFFDSNGMKIRFVEQGQGDPIVLIHGYTGTVERHWINNGIFADLAKDHRVIALDCRGHGKSDKPHDPDAYRGEMAKDIVRLLDHLQIRRAHIVGFSMGAYITGQLLASVPERFMTATLAGGGPARTWTPADDEEAEASAREMEGDTPFRSLILAVSPPGARPPAPEEIRKQAQPLIEANDLKALAALNRSLKGGTLVLTDTQLRAIRVPVLAAIGSEDRNLARVRELEKLMPTLRLVVVDGATHGGSRGVLRRPEFVAALRRFLK